ncbi:MAG TPA: class I SAM-dependent methyltransferase, partial [Micromonosporaceae bacterium]|nr:class I SAM-dependent methyltransferase [Micromonosporaceae bacterium]
PPRSSVAAAGDFLHMSRSGAMTEDPTVASYDTVARRYADEIGDELAGKPVERAMYACLAELVAPLATALPVGDVGCGPGHVTRHLADLGLRAVGVDASPGMVEVARERYPGLEFRAGTFAALGVPDAGWAGAVVAYSLIHLGPGDRPAAYAELARAVTPGGWLLASFHVRRPGRNEPGTVAHLDEWWGHRVSLDFHFLDPDDVSSGLAKAGFAVMTRTDRQPWPGAEEPTERCHLLARRV